MERFLSQGSDKNLHRLNSANDDSDVPAHKCQAIELLRDHALFKNFPSRQLTKIALLMEPITISNRTKIRTAGDTIRNVILVFKGEVQELVCADGIESQVSIKGQGSLLGGVDILKGLTKFSRSYVALSAVEGYIISLQALSIVMANKAAVQSYIHVQEACSKFKSLRTDHSKVLERIGTRDQRTLTGLLSHNLNSVDSFKNDLTTPAVDQGAEEASKKAVSWHPTPFMREMRNRFHTSAELGGHVYSRDAQVPKEPNFYDFKPSLAPNIQQLQEPDNENKQPIEQNLDQIPITTLKQRPKLVLNAKPATETNSPDIQMPLVLKVTNQPVSSPKPTQHLTSVFGEWKKSNNDQIQELALTLNLIATDNSPAKLLSTGKSFKDKSSLPAINKSQPTPRQGAILTARSPQRVRERAVTNVHLHVKGTLQHSNSTAAFSPSMATGAILPTRRKNEIDNRSRLVSNVL